MGSFRRESARAMVLGMGVLACVSACNSGHIPNQEEEERASATHALGASTSATVTLRLPERAGLPSVALAATNSLIVGAAVAVVAPETDFVTIVNTGGADTNVGSSARLGNVYSQAPIELGSAVQANGDVQGAGPVSVGAGAHATGEIRDHVAQTPLQSFSFTVALPAPGPDVTVGASQTNTLAPGSYGRVRLAPGATLRLASGTFYLNELSVSPGAQVLAADGPVVVYVVTQLQLGGSFAAGTQANRVLVVFLGRGVVSIVSSFAGTLVAPNALLQLAAAARATGSFFANDISVGSAAVVTLAGYLDWEDFFELPEPRPIDLHPRLRCVERLGANDYRAVFGYLNDGFEKQLVRAGSTNSFAPVPLGRGQTENFLPGRVASAFATRFDGTPLTWTTPGGKAVASAASPACPTTPCAGGCGDGEACVGGACVTLCGDALCAGEEGCGSCVADCGCQAGEACYQNGCAEPVRCGSEWQCGSGVSFGTAVDCGACAGGAACVNHVCQ